MSDPDARRPRSIRATNHEKDAATDFLAIARKAGVDPAELLGRLRAGESAPTPKLTTTSQVSSPKGLPDDYEFQGLDDPVGQPTIPIDLPPAPADEESNKRPTARERRRKRLLELTAPYAPLLLRIPQEKLTAHRERVLRALAIYAVPSKRPYVTTQRILAYMREAGLNGDEQTQLLAMPAALAHLLYSNLVTGGDGTRPWLTTEDLVL